jgi:hypothetical protein
VNYTLLAWSRGNCARSAGQPIDFNPYKAGEMHDAWRKGFNWNRKP